jgi:hypothetical protein
VHEFNVAYLFRLEYPKRKSLGQHFPRTHGGLIQ